MWRRSMLELSHRRVIDKSARRQNLAAQTQRIPSSLFFARDFSTPPNNAPPKSGSIFSKVLIGSVIVGAAGMAAYSTGYLDHILVRESHNPTQAGKVDTSTKDIEKMLKDSEDTRDQTSPSMSQDSQPLSTNMEQSEKSSEFQSQQTPVEKSPISGTTTQFPATHTPDLTPTENDKHFHEIGTSKLLQNTVAADDQIVTSEQKFDEGVNKEISSETAPSKRQEKAENTPEFTEENAAINYETDKQEHPGSQGQSEDLLGHAEEPSRSLLDEYHLTNKEDHKKDTSLSEESTPEFAHSSMDKEVSKSAARDSGDAYVSSDGKLILDLLQAIHVAEERQAELDARKFAEEKMAMKEKYEKELKDARARELMYAEEAAILDKEIKKERAKAAAALKSFLEQAEERLKTELEQKEKEAELKLKETQEFAKAEFFAAVAQEKAAQIEKMEEANLNINALCMAFYARSEEARQNHSIHKLALGALALEDALANGLPIQSELDALRPHFEGVDKDALLDLALSSLPEETRTHGTDTLLQLNQKFDQLKGTLRHFSFIPPGGGGLLTNALAHVASFLKVREADRSGDGIESVINRVESLLVEGKLAEAADALEIGVKGSAAAEVVGDWVRRARNRAITEQALMLLQSYATSLSVSLT